MASNIAAANKGDDKMSGDGDKTPAVTRPQQPAAALKCPRCDSPNTKFCYYNNYSQSQPRYYCKTCRRYWTKGGALRTVPVGGTCRRRKMTKSSPAATRYSSDIGGLGLGFHLLGGIKIPSYNTSAAALLRQLSAALLAMPPIEPVNQDLQWNLQQKMLGVPSAPDLENQIQNPQPILLEIPTPPEATFESSSSRIADEATDWLFDDVTFPATNTCGNNGNGKAPDDDWDDLIQCFAIDNL